MPEPVTILVVDDEQIMRDGSSRILSRDGWGVIIAENGQQGLEVIRSRSNQIDVILLDLMMHGMGGMEVFDHIRSIPTLLSLSSPGMRPWNRLLRR